MPTKSIAYKKEISSLNSPILTYQTETENALNELAQGPIYLQYSTATHDIIILPEEYEQQIQTLFQ